MIILTTSLTTQQLSLIPRNYPSAFTMDIRDDSTNITISYEITGAITLGNYLNFSNIFNPRLVENHFYDVELFTDVNKTNSIYKDRIFCTDQIIDQLNNDYYNLNDGQFTTYNGYDNTYIVI
tara:strand:+ start:507 stop:872 length:366 start_codon:yes stop_codon:yes gene_type:complete